MNLIFYGNQVTYFFKLNHQYFLQWGVKVLVNYVIVQSADTDIDGFIYSNLFLELHVSSPTPHFHKLCFGLLI